jgi:hypothetical protein
MQREIVNIMISAKMTKETELSDLFENRCGMLYNKNITRDFNPVYLT